MRKFLLSTAAILIAAPACANTISGSYWHVPEAAAQNVVPGSEPARTPDVTFLVTGSLNFSATNATVGAWLASSGAFNITENTAGTLTSLMDNFSIGSLVDFQGQVTLNNGDSFTVAHDDGLTLTVGGVPLISAPGPTSPTTTTTIFTGASGTYMFDLIYGECCRGPAVLQTNLPLRETPLPATLPLLASGLVGIVALARRKRKTV
jgi:hypothetical protein